MIVCMRQSNKKCFLSHDLLFIVLVNHIKYLIE